MTKFFRLVLLLAGLGGAAAPCLSQSIEKYLNSTFETLDKNSIVSGILIQKAPIFHNPYWYRGQAELPDSLLLSLDQFGLLYGQFRAAAMGKSYLPDPSVYLGKRHKQYHPGDTIPLMLMATQYDYIPKGALAAGAFTWHEKRLYDAPGRGPSPYRQDTCFVFTCLQQKVRGNNLKFQLPEELIFNNMNWEISQVQMDFNDGRGFRSVTPGQVVSIRYADSGKKKITLQYRPQKNRTLFAGTFVEIEPAAEERDYPDEPDEVVNLGGCSMSFFYACDDKKLRRPLIVAEGFGGEIVNFTKMLSLIQPNNLPDGSSLKDFLNERQYDLIWVDWANSGASIVNNANNLIAVLDWVNTKKHENGSSEPNILIGASMGGLVGKYALLQMHNVEGRDSEVSKFFSYDSPINTGANVPLGIQAFVRDIFELASNIGASTAAFQDGLSILDSESARDMTMVRVEVEYTNNDYILVTTSAEHDAFYGQMAALEQIRPLGHITRHIALSNGSGEGRLQENLPQNEILKIYLKIDDIGDGFPWELFYNIHFNAKAWGTVTGRSLIYDQITTVNNWLGQTEIFSTNLTLSSPLVLDDAPGSFTDFGLPVLESVGNTFINDIAHLSESEFVVNLEKYCFIPSIGSLNNPAGTNITNSTPLSASVSDRATASFDNTVSSPYPPNLPEYNQDHVSMNSRIATIIANELEPAETSELQSSLASGEIYNFGQGASISVTDPAPLSTPNEISQDVSIGTGGELWINRNNRIGYVHLTDNPFNRKPHPFAVSVPGSECGLEESVTVTVQPQGKLIVGEYTQVGNSAKLSFNAGSELSVETGGLVQVDDHSLLFFREGSQIDMQSGSTVHLINGSRLVVEDGSTMHVHSGAVLWVQGSAMVHIKPGAQLILDPGAIVRLESPGAAIQIQGDLVLNGDIDFKGLGYFDFASGNRLVFGPGVTNFRLTGPFKGNRMLRLSADLEIASGHGVDWKDGALDATPGGRLMIQTGGTCRMEKMTVTSNVSSDIIDAQGASSLSFINTDFSTGRKFITSLNSGIHYFHLCSMSQMEEGITAEDGLGAFTLSECTFSNYLTHAVKMTNRATLNGFYSTWQGQGAYTGLDLNNVQQAVLRGCNLGGHNAGPGGPFDPNDLGSYSRAINLDQVPFLVLRESGVYNNAIGILADGNLYGPSNVFLLQGTYVANNRAGVYMNGTQTDGLVLMDCAKMLNNETGIKGSDVTLMIDAINAQQHPLDGDEPNEFLRDAFHANSDLYIDVCYIAKTPVSPLPMRRNWWAVNSILTRQLNPTDFIQILRNGCMVPALVNTLPELTAPPAFCQNEEFAAATNFPGQGADADCKVSLAPNQPLSDLSEWWHTAYQHLRGGDVETALSGFQPLSDLWQPDLSSFTSNCQLYIQTARAIVSGGGLPRPSENRNASTRIAPLMMAPNPTNGSTALSLPNGQYRIRVFDAMGQIKLDEPASNTYGLDTKAWTPGIYWVEALSMEGDRMSGKLVVSK
ncbi:MAG: T9SS type A sorting domain-containing protein [Saprospiraceae bacterium]|nr:T9SS type A sorting domain-containing protein [Saprospiraceae bacterium]